MKPADWLILQKKVRFGDCDSAGVIHFHNLLKWSHEAWEESIEIYGIPYQDIFPDFSIRKSKIISKGISAGFSDMTYRGLVDINSKAKNSSNYTQCDSLLMGNKCGAHTVPYNKNRNFDSNIAHEATTSKISEEQLHYCQLRGLNPEEAVGLIVNGFCKEVLQQLPMEFAVEAQKLVGISLEGSVG